MRLNRSFIVSSLLFVMLILMLLHPAEVMEGAKYGLLLWYNSVVPALFPFMILSGLIISQGSIHIFMEPVRRVLSKVIPISANGCYVLISGMLCGYPMGAKSCADFIANGQLSVEEGKFLMALSNHPSPMFIFGYMYPFFASYIPVWIVILSVYGPLLLLAPFASYLYLRNKQPEFRRKKNRIPMTEIRTEFKNAKTEPVTAQASTADECILSSVLVLCKIGGYLVLFSILIVFLRQIDLIPMELRLLMIGSMEMTTAIREFVATFQNKTAFISSIAALTFGGISGIFQTNAVISKKAGLSIRPYILWKLLHAGSSALLTAILCNLFL